MNFILSSLLKFYAKVRDTLLEHNNGLSSFQELQTKDCIHFHNRTSLSSPPPTIPCLPPKFATSHSDVTMTSGDGHISKCSAEAPDNQLVVEGFGTSGPQARFAPPYLPIWAAESYTAMIRLTRAAGHGLVKTALWAKREALVGQISPTSRYSLHQDRGTILVNAAATKSWSTEWTWVFVPRACMCEWDITGNSE